MNERRLQQSRIRPALLASYREDPSSVISWTATAVVCVSVAAAVAFPIVGNLVSAALQEWVFANPLRSFVVVAVLLGGGVIANRRLRTRAQESEFGLFVRTEDLTPEHLGFEVVAPRVESTDLSRRPYVTGVYVHRVAVPYTKRKDAAAREFDERQLLTILEEGYSFLLIGAPTEGKTRTLFEVCRRLRGFIVVKPKVPSPSDGALELLRGKDVLCLFDDVNASIGAGIDLFAFYQRVARVANLRPIAAACRNGDELASLVQLCPTSSIHRIYEGFNFRLSLRPPTSDEQSGLIRALGQAENEPFFSLGDISMRHAFDVMLARFDRLTPSARESLWSLQLLTFGGIDELTHSRLSAVKVGCSATS